MAMGWRRRKSLASLVLGKCMVPSCGEQVPRSAHLYPGGLSPSPPPNPVPASESDPLEPSQLLVQQGSPGLGGPHLAFCTPASPGTICVCSVTSVLSNFFPPHGLQPARLLCPWDSPGKNTGAGCPALLQGIFLTQGLNPCLMHYLAVPGRHV